MRRFRYDSHIPLRCAVVRGAGHVVRRAVRPLPVAPLSMVAPFADAAEVQSRALGFDVARVFVSHPIQDRTDEEMTVLADEAAAELISSSPGRV